MTRPFRFKQFTVSQSRAPMKVGTDGVLLGAWVACHDKRRALDIGTGTGLIALMLAQRNPALRLVAIEPNADALADASANVANSDFAGRIDLINTTLDSFSGVGDFDLIVSNPPFFERDLQSPDTGRSMARHVGDFDYLALANATALLSRSGVLAGIYPVATFKKFDRAMRAQGLLPGRICEVKPTPEKPPHRVLFEYGFDGSPQAGVQTLVIEAGGRHQYSPEYVELTRDFYLNF